MNARCRVFLNGQFNIPSLSMHSRSQHVSLQLAKVGNLAGLGHGPVRAALVLKGQFTRGGD
eukprot:4120147-Lingulodinium_polyedra.AAC.1